jgi:hypothetical protein
MKDSFTLILIIMAIYYIFVYMPSRVLQQESDLAYMREALRQLLPVRTQRSMVLPVRQPPTEAEWNEQIARNMPNNTLVMASGGLPEVNHMDALGDVGDDRLAKHVSHNQKKSKQSLDNRSLWNKNSLIPYLEEELEEHANSRWWDDDSLESRFVYQTDNILVFGLARGVCVKLISRVVFSLLFFATLRNPLQNLLALVKINGCL